MAGLMLVAGFAGVANAQVYKDPNAPIEDRVNDLLSQMTLEEKMLEMAGGTTVTDPVAIATGATSPNERLGIPGLKFTDAGRGVTRVPATTFPVQIARGASWNPELEERVGEAIGKEVRGAGYNILNGPCLNIVMHPRCGRTQESYGEDQLILGSMAVPFIIGLQNQKAIADAKHFACNNIETTRKFQNSIIDERTLREVYLPHFEAIVKEAETGAIMAAYNQINGQYCCENYHLLREILKGEWGYSGMVVSDWWGTIQPLEALTLDRAFVGISDPSAIVITPSNIPMVPTVGGCIAAGLDVEMPIGVLYSAPLLTGVTTGIISESLVDDAVKRILREKFRFGFFDGPSPYDSSIIMCSEHVDLTLESERESIVLLKNDNNILPFDAGQIKSIAVIGPAADDADRTGDHGSSSTSPGAENIVTPLAGITNRAGSGIEVNYLDGSDTAAAAELAKTCDAAVVVVGRNYAEEGEGNDLETLALSGNQPELINAVGAANKNTAVVVIAGSAVTMGEWIDNAPALLMAWYAGMQGGNAIADVLFGDVNPSGKLPLTFPKSEDQLPPFDYNNCETVYSYYLGYRHFDKYNIEPQFEFGYGLSYTTFEFSNLRMSHKAILPDGTIYIDADVTNTGDVAGKEVAQLYIGYEGSAVDRPIKELKGFDKMYLEPGETKTVAFELDAEDLGYWNVGNKEFETELIKHIVYVGDSSRDLPLVGSFMVGETQDISKDYGKGARTPGFECIALIAGLAVAIALAQRRK